MSEINAKLAADIHTIIDMVPSVHDQANWFYVYEGGNHNQLTPEDVHAVQLLAETKDAVEKDVSYRDFEPTVDCNATLCVAGWACILNGYSLVLDDDGRGYSTVFAKDKDGEYTEVMDKGRELLGLSEGLAEWLFTETSDNTALEALEDLTAGETPQAYLDYLSSRAEEDNECTCVSCLY